ncbi:hypothetical protein [Amycolatopsis sp. NPDC051371]|uniref:hypothetical protein n=1 Tax=Amycolatopsis sp. NPDC051371 TaxID=3155800 RepID=UPI0034232FCD
MSDEFSEELSRIEARASAAPPPWLAVLEVEPIDGFEPYGRKLREIARAAVSVARDEEFDADELDASGVPRWFADLTDGRDADSGGIPASSHQGSADYYQARGEREWDVQEWLFCFEPELRRWSWWDLTTPDGRRAFIWIDTRGEAVIPAEELWWAAFASGARSVSGLVMKTGEEWARQPSAGILQTGESS